MPTWIFYMAASCFASFLVGYILSWLWDEIHK